MNFAVTALYALPLAALYLVLWFRVSGMRSKTGVSFGDRGDVLLLQRVRQHGNFVEWTSFVLILIILAEGNGTSAPYLHIAGAALLAGRVVHPFGLTVDNAAHPLRIVGSSLNLLATLILMVCLGVNLLGH